jgi:hypothetical protein
MEVHGTMHMNHAESKILWEKNSKYSNTMTKMMQPSFSATLSNKYSNSSTNLPNRSSKKSIITTRRVQRYTKTSRKTKRPTKNPLSRTHSQADTKLYTQPRILHANIFTQVMRSSTFTFCNYHQQKVIEWILKIVCLILTNLTLFKAIILHTVTFAKKRCSIIKLCISMKQTRYLRFILSDFLITVKIKPLFLLLRFWISLLL